MLLWKFREGQTPFKFGILIILASTILLSYPVFPLHTFNKVNNTFSSFSSNDWAHIFRKSLLTRALEEINSRNVKAVNCYLREILPEPKQYKVIDFCPSPRWPTSVWREFGDEDFKIGTIAEEGYVTGLSGCAVVVILTKNGVWMAHFWEVPGFSRSPLMPDGQEVDFKTDRFQQDVLDFIKNGIATASPDEDPPLQGAKLGDHRAQLQNANIWILAPTADKSSSGFAYPSKIEQLKYALKSQLDKVTFHDLQYQKPKPNMVMQVLFEYDPGPKKRVRLLYNNYPVAFDTDF